jgi:hypothetical protein
MRLRRSLREVWFAGAMGLLDDAIREHLEFKRLHGADPGEVARQEHEALGPVYRGEGSPPAEPAGIREGDDRQDQTPTPSEGSAESTRRAPGVAGGGQETAELDMRTVLRTEQPVRAAVAAADAAPPSPSASPQSSLGEGRSPADPSRESSAEGSLEWEVPDRSQPGDREHGDAAAVDDGEPVEDVLEETPDFLRDTPDQDRLWFEQQPPRDFDFDK